MTEKLVFDSAIEGLIQCVHAEISTKCNQRLLQIGFDPKAKLKPAYPAEQWAGVVKILGEEIYPGLGATESHRQLALRTLEVFSRSLIGAAMFAIVGLLGPDRTIGRMTRNFRSSCNYIETTCTEVAPHSWEIWVNDVSGVPGFYLGLLEGGFRRAGAKGLTIVVQEQKHPAAIYRASWGA